MAYFSDREQVPKGFDRMADRYDLLQRPNPGYQRHLVWSARRLGVAPTSRGPLLDLCCGTGLSTLALVKSYPRAEVTALDASENMLALARKKAALANVRFVLGNAMNPEAAGVEGPYEAILMAYGIRNVPDINQCLARIHALLRPGGSVVFHEYSVAGAWLSQSIWQLVSGNVILPLGKLTTGSDELFRYLRASVLAFDSVAQFESRLRSCGFGDIKTLPMNGWQRGIVHSFFARRPFGGETEPHV